jgi:hypothetical protein
MFTQQKLVLNSSRTVGDGAFTGTPVFIHHHMRIVVVIKLTAL